MFNKPLTKGMLHSLEACKVILYLTGSRYFGHYRENSDYDFFCEATQENFDMIASLGLWTREETAVNSIAIHSISYMDTNTVEIWKHYGHGIEPDIHIQFVKDCDWKLRAQKLLGRFPFIHIDKAQAKQVWKWALNKTR